MPSSNAQLSRVVGRPVGVRVPPSVPCRNQKGLRKVLEALFNSTASKGGMNRTNCKPRANNSLFWAEIGVLPERC